MQRWLFLLVMCVLTPVIRGQTVKGELTANGKAGKLSHVAAYEVESKTEKGYMDTVVVVSDRELPREVALNETKLGEWMTKKGLVALRVLINPDCKVLSAAPFHPALKAFISSGAFIKWEPSAYNETTVAGRFSSEGGQDLGGENWTYDITFSAPIILDPKGVTRPK